MATAVTTVDQSVEWEMPEQVGLWRDAWQRFRRNHLAVLGLMVVVFLIFEAFILAPLLVHFGLLTDPINQDTFHIEEGPLARGHILGTDELGRDTLSRLMFGARMSLSVGILVQAIVLVVGGSIGLTAGYLGGRVDNLLMRFTDVWYAFPDLIFVLVLVAVFGPNLWSIFGAIGLVNWVNLARLVRGQVLSIKEKEFVEAARAVGTPPLRIMLRHLVPNAAGPIIVTLAFGVPQAIFTEAVLSFLGVGIPPPTPTWGQMVFDGYEAIYANVSSAAIPSLAIGLTMLSFTFIGDGLRDALDPRMRR